MKLIPKTCKQCGIIFYVEPYRDKTANYCSKVCCDLSKTTLVKRKCVQCGKAFKTKPSLIINGWGMHCSRECMNKSRNVPKIENLCKNCNTPIYVLETDIKRGNGKYCSKECAIEGQRTAFEKQCITCGKTFIAKPSDDKNGKSKYCSKVCFDIDVKKTGMRRGCNNSSWKGGISFYPYCPKFNKDFKERVRAFFGYKCVVCGKSQHDLTRRLDVHHVHHNKNTCCDDSLPYFVPLCKSCHSKTRWAQDYYIELFTKLIVETYGGKSYYSKEEFEAKSKT